MNHIKTQCPAKINLDLQILDKREDGYHNIRSHFQLIVLGARGDKTKTRFPLNLCHVWYLH